MAARHQTDMAKAATKRMFVPGDVVTAKQDLATGELARFGSGPYEVVGSERPFGGTEWLFLKRLPDGPRLEKSVHPSCLVPESSLGALSSIHTEQSS
jgi:hypothetical protein